jgi:choline kinase
LRFPKRVYTAKEVKKAKELVDKGYKHLLTAEGDPNFKQNNILRSLFYAEDEMDDDFIFSYSDILYNKSIVEKLIKKRQESKEI